MVHGGGGDGALVAVVEVVYGAAARHKNNTGTESRIIAT